MVKTTILVAVLILMLSAGYIITSWDRTDDGVKILNDDDYEEMDNEVIIKNPATGESWSSVEEYRFRNINESGDMNGDN